MPQTNNCFKRQASHRNSMFACVSTSILLLLLLLLSLLLLFYPSIFQSGL